MKNPSVVRVRVRSLGGLSMGHMLRLSRTASRVKFSGDCTLPVGSETSLTLRHQHDAADATIRALVTERVELPQGRAYSFSHTLVQEDIARLPSALRGMLDDRRDHRHRLAQPVDVRVLAPGTPVIEGQLVDISLGGCALLLTREADLKLCPLRQVRVNFHFPGGRDFDINTSIRHRALAGDAVKYGLSFAFTVAQRGERERLHGIVTDLTAHVTRGA